jgi:hypothetical protein
MIFLMRDPVDRLWSAVRQRCKNNNIADPDAAFRRLSSIDGVLLRSRYELTLQALQSSVPPEQVLVLFFEDLFSPDDDRAFCRLLDFLGLTSAEADRDRPLNKIFTSDMSDATRADAVQALAPTYQYVAEQFDAFPARWGEHLALVG